MTTHRAKLAALIFALVLAACAVTLHLRSQRAMNQLEAAWVEHVRQVETGQRK